MNPSQIVAALLTTVLDFKDEGAPSGSLYAALMTVGVSYSEYSSILTVLVDRRLVTLSANVVRLTPTGEELARKLDALLPKK